MKTNNKIFVIKSSGDTAPIISGDVCPIMANVIEACDSDTKIELTSGSTIFNKNILPNNDNVIDLGTSVKRFRNLNTISGTSTVWISTNKIQTPIIDLGLDSYGNLRLITADNSIISNDDLNGGNY